MARRRRSPLEGLMGGGAHLPWKVGVATVRELYGVMMAEHVVGGVVVASGEFSEEVQKFAERRSIKLVATQSLLSMIGRAATNISPRKSRANRGTSLPQVW